MLQLPRKTMVTQLRILSVLQTASHLILTSQLPGDFELEAHLRDGKLRPREDKGPSSKHHLDQASVITPYTGSISDAAQRHCGSRVASCHPACSVFSVGVLSPTLSLSS